MSVLTDKQIRDRVSEMDMISPFVAKQVKYDEGLRVVSYGLSSFGYDVRAGLEWLWEHF